MGSPSFSGFVEGMKDVGDRFVPALPALATSPAPLDVRPCNRVDPLRDRLED